LKQNLDGHVEIQVEDKIALNIFHRKQNTYNILESFFFFKSVFRYYWSRMQSSH